MTLADYIGIPREWQKDVAKLPEPETMKAHGKRLYENKGFDYEVFNKSTGKIESETVGDHEVARDIYNHIIGGKPTKNGNQFISWGKRTYLARVHKDAKHIVMLTITHDH